MKKSMRFAYKKEAYKLQWVNNKKSEKINKKLNKKIFKVYKNSTSFTI